MKACGIVVMLGVLLTLAACSSGGMGNTTPPPSTFTIGGTVTGLAGSGLVLQNNGGNNLPVTANGAFTFSTAISGGAAYKVTVLTQPSTPAQNCVVTAGSGTATANVTNVLVTCTTITYTVGGTVTGLAGTGLVLQNNGGNNLPVTTNGSFTFSTAITSGAAYDVTVLTQPSTPAQNCVVTSGSGTVTANVTNIVVTCTTITYTVGGTVTGLAGTGLVLQNNGGNNLPVTANGSFTFSTALTSGAAYDVTVLTQPSIPAQNCVVTSGSGTATGNVTSVVVTCTTITYTVGGSVTGLSGSNLVLQNNKGDDLPNTGNGPFTFSTPVTSGTGYNVTVLTQPTNLWQTCLVTGGMGTANANVSNVLVTCTTNKYTIGGTVTGLLGSGLVLQDNNGDDLTIGNATGFNTPFTFATSVASGSAYAVTILTQPSSPAQTCWLGTANGTNTGTVQGTIVANVQIGCSDFWVYEKGPQIANQSGVYGTQTLYGPKSVPGGRYSSASWMDTAGNFWLFGGLGWDSGSTSAGNLNDLWEYSPSMGDWRWVSGSIAKNQPGTYTGGTLSPGSRNVAMTWTDAAGNFWLFGGFGYDSGTPTAGELNDLWEYNPTTGTWTWRSGSDLVNQTGVYSGTEVPGARDSAVTWIDGSGNLWLFGGNGYDSAGSVGYLNDLWEFNPGTTTWTWVGGSNLSGQGGTYGILGKSAHANVPGARYGAAAWLDKSGNLWLFGGFGKDGDTPTNTAELNDLWQYNPVLSEWTWMGGSHIGASTGIYGTEGTPASGNVPGARQGPTAWTDANGDFWMFGGLGFDSTSQAPNELNDLWKYSVSTGEWAWMAGADISGAVGVYGTAGVPDPTAVPGARGGASGWIDATGNLWLFGGNGPKSGGSFDDLWQFQP